MASVDKQYLGDNRLLFDRKLKLQLKINTLQQLNILSSKQAKYCGKLTRLNNITYARRNKFTSAREQQCSCDVAYSSAQQQPVFRSVRHFFCRKRRLCYLNYNDTYFVFVSTFLPRDAMHSADCAVARCLSVCPSVTCRYSVETFIHILKLITQSGCHTILHCESKKTWTFFYLSITFANTVPFK